MNLRTVPATEAHLAELPEWFPDQEAVRLWAGPWFTYPYSAESFRADIAWDSLDSFALLDEQDRMIAFGQIYRKNSRVHLARLAVDPNWRGRGVGRALVKALFETGRALFGYAEASLFVYRDNTIAIRCYESTGFHEALYPPDEEPDPDILYMVLEA